MSDIDIHRPPDRDPLDADQDQIARLLRFAGPRLAVPAERAMRVRAAVHQEWRDSIRSRSRIQAYLMTGAGLAAAAALALAIGLTIRSTEVAPPSPLTPAATVDTVSGVVLSLGQEDDSETTGARLAVGDTMFSGSAVRTDPGGRAALRLAGGQSLRLGYGTLVRFVSEREVVLTAGRLYLDSGASDEPSSSVLVHTPFGMVEDVGTQFEVNVGEVGVRVRVREGLVSLEREGQTFEAAAGVELNMADDGSLTRASVPVFGSQWHWVLEIAPPFELEGSRLESFLGWVARETGWQLIYADSELEASTGNTVLHGSIAGLRPDQALEAVLPTCGLVYREEGGRITIAARLP